MIAWSQLRDLGVAVVPYRTDERAFRLGIQALRDRPHIVRWRACGLLAYALRRDGLEVLRPLLQHSDVRTRADAAAAIDAIENANHHLYVDRDHSGRLRWVVDDQDHAGPRKQLSSARRASQTELRFDTVRIMAWVYTVYSLYPLRALSDPKALPPGEAVTLAILSLTFATAAWSATRRKRIGYYFCLFFSIALLPGVPVGTFVGWNMIRALRRNRDQFWPYAPRSRWTARAIRSND